MRKFIARLYPAQDKTKVTTRFPVPIATVLISMLCVSFISLYIRLFFGVNLFDEMYVHATAYRIFLGDLPFYAELNIAQSSSLLLVPFYQMLDKALGNTDGIVLISRTFFLGFVFIIYWRCTHWFQSRLSLTLAMLVCLPILSYSPTYTYDIFYKTISPLLYCFGLVALSFAPSRTSHVWSGISLSIATFINGAFFPIWCLVLWMARSKRHYAVSAILTGSVLALFLWGWVGNEGLTNIWNYHLQRGSSLLTFSERLRAAFLQFTTAHFLKKIIWIAMGFGILTIIGKKRFLPWVLPALFLIPLWLGQGVGGYALYLISLGPILYLLNRQDREYRSAFKYLWFSAVFGAFWTSILTDSGIPNSSIALLPAILSVVFGVALQIKTIRGFNQNFALIITMVIPTLFFCYSLTQPEPWHTEPLNTRISKGPLKGIWSSHKQVDCLMQLDNDIKQNSDETTRGLIYGACSPTSYFSFHRPPLASSVWRCDQQQPSCLRRFERQSKPGDLIILSLREVTCMEGSPYNKYDHSDPFFKKINETFLLVEKRSEYKIFKRTNLPSNPKGNFKLSRLK